MAPRLSAAAASGRAGSSTPNAIATGDRGTPWYTAPVIHDADDERGVPAGIRGQARRHRADATQRRGRQHERRLDREADRIVQLLARPVGRQHPGREHSSGLEGLRRLPSRVLGRVVDGKPGSGQRRQQQHRHQGARPAPVSASRHHAERVHAERAHAERAHPNVNPILLAPAPSSQLAVTCATVTGEVRAWCR